MLEVVWTAGADIDFQEAFADEDLVSEPRANQLLATTERLTALLATFPEMSPVWKFRVRRSVIRRTNYGLFYTVESSRLIVVAFVNLRLSPKAIEQIIARRLP